MKLLGLDIGTTTICGLVLDSEDGRVVSVNTQSNPAGLPAREPWEMLQDADAALTVARRIVEDTLETHHDIEAVGVAGQMHGILYIDSAGKAVSPLYTWEDGRGDCPFEGGSYASFLSAVIGRPVSTGMGAVTHFFNTKNGIVPRNMAALCTIGDYVAMRLAGARAPVMDATNAASLGAFDLEELSFARSALRESGLDPSVFPEVRTDYPVIGEIRAGPRVFPAMGDNQASFLGSVADPLRQALVNVGTGSQFSLFVPSYREINGIDLRPLPYGGYIGVGAGLCGGRAYAALRHFFQRTVRLIAGRDEDVPWETMNRMSPAAGAQPLAVDTRFSGTRVSPGIRGSITNIGLANFTPEHLASGVREGIVAELKSFSECFDAAERDRLATLIGSGNAIRLGEPLRRAFEAGFGVPLRTPRHREETSFGAALVAGVAAGGIPSREAACSLVRYEDS